MRQSYFLHAKELFPGSDIVRKYTFKTVSTRGSSALLARANHNLAMNYAILRAESALLQEKDCFECLHRILRDLTAQELRRQPRSLIAQRPCCQHIKELDSAKPAPSTIIAP